MAMGLFIFSFLCFFFKYLYNVDYRYTLNTNFFAISAIQIKILIIMCGSHLLLLTALQSFLQDCRRIALEKRVD